MLHCGIRYPYSSSRLPFQPVDATLALPVSTGVFTPPVRGQLVIIRRSSLRHTLAQPSSAPLLASSEPMTPPSIPLQNLFKSLKSSAYAPSSSVLFKVLHRPIEIAAVGGRWTKLSEVYGTSIIGRFSNDRCYL